MAHRPKGAIATRVAVGLASLAFPLAAAGAAQAAIAGAQPASMSAHPVLRSATIDASNPYEIHACFDKAVLLNAGTSYFTLGGYNASSLNSYDYEPSQVTADNANANCINAFYNNLQNGGTQGLTQFTVFQAESDAVTAQNGGGYNYTDTVGVTGSTSHAGTRGNSSPPDLAGILAPTSSSPNTYTFVFNKAVAYTSNGYYLILADGTEVPSSAASVVPTNPTYVAVTFPATYGGENVNANASQGFVSYQTVYADYDYYDYGNLDESTPVASSTATLAAPHVVSAVLNSDNDSITYTFNETVNASGVTAGDFYAELANGSRVAATGTVANSSTTGTTTVTATFSKELANQAEFAVVAYAAQGAVTSFTPTGAGGTSSVDSSAPIGGNPGAFARAFTTAPDVFGVTINKSVGSGSNQAATITVSLDDRTRAINTNDITLYDKTGQVVSSGGTTCTVPNGTTTDNGTDASAFANGPGPETVTCSYPLGALDTVASVGFAEGAFQGTLGTYSAQTTTPAESSADSDATSVAQIDAPVPTAAIVRAYKVNLAHIKAHKAHKAHKARRNHKKH